MPLKELLEQYEQRRRAEALALTRRREEASCRDARFLAIEEARQGATTGISKLLRKGLSSKEAAKQAKGRLQELDLEERALLAAHGLPEAYLTPRANCPLCHDTGYMGEEGRELCACIKRLLLLEECAGAHIDSRETFENFNLEIFPTEKQKKQMENARKRAERYADSLPGGEKRNFILLGMAGLGKTYLLNCIAARALQRNIRVKKATSYSLFDEILQGIRQGTDNAAPLFSVPLLLIDDLGTEPTLNNITREYLFAILNERRLRELHTVLASNLDVHALQETYGERVVSRLISAEDADILLLAGENLRLGPRGPQPRGSQPRGSQSVNPKTVGQESP